MLQLKQQLYDLCIDYINQRISTAKNAVESAQGSANQEIKSSAGDKYETTRTMMQQEAQWSRTQLAEAQRLRQELDQISIDGSVDTAHSGSLVYTSKGVFFIAISAGRLSVGEETFFAISPVSPLGMKLLGTTEGSKFSLNGQVFNVLKVV